MGKNSSCCVSKCKTGYKSNSQNKSLSKTSLHGFPINEEKRSKWIQAIPNGASIRTKSAVVCSMHFLEEDFREKGLTCGQHLEIRLLKKDAVPSLFPGVPHPKDFALGTNNPGPPKAVPSVEQKKASSRSDSLIRLNYISSLKELKERVPTFGMPSNVFMDSNESSLTFFRVQKGSKGAPTIAFSLCVSSNLTFSMYLQERPVPPSVVDHVLSATHIKTCSQVVDILATLENLQGSLDQDTEAHSGGKEDPLNLIQVHIGEIMDSIQGLDKRRQRSIKFLMEQSLIFLGPMKARRYSNFTLAMASQWERISPKLYKHMVEEDLLALPTVRYMKQLKSKGNKVNPKNTSWIKHEADSKKMN